jgi:glutamate--cysteine ligase
LGEEKAPAEPVMYMLGAKVIGSFYRMNASRNNNQNLNSPGMEFTFLNSDNKFYYAYNVIALLSQLAAAKEVESYVEESLLLKK